MAFYDPTFFDVHVLLVDHDMNALFETTRLLQFNSYRVTPVGDASIASSMLFSSQGNASFNLVMVDINTSNPLGFKLMHEAIGMDLPVIVMATIATPALVKCAIEDGAFLFMQKPASSEELKYIWQHILRETTRKNKEKLKSCGETSTNNHNNRRSRSMHGDKMARNAATSHQKGRLGEIISFGSESCDNDDVAVGEGSSMKPKLCTEWTPELHEKFMAAVRQLGEGRCFPKDILDLMNVPGLKRMQVASHLQKCRHGWQLNFNGRQGRRPNILKPTRSVTKRFGAFPRGSQAQFPPNDGGLAQASNTNVDNGNLSLNEINGRNMLGIEPLDFGVSEDGLRLVGNSFNVNAFDYDFAVTDQNSDVAAAGIVEDANFWNSWLADTSREA